MLFSSVIFLAKFQKKDICNAFLSSAFYLSKASAKLHIFFQINNFFLIHPEPHMRRALHPDGKGDGKNEGTQGNCKQILQEAYGIQRDNGHNRKRGTKPVRLRVNPTHHPAKRTVQRLKPSCFSSIRRQKKVPLNSEAP